MIVGWNDMYRQMIHLLVLVGITFVNTQSAIAACKSIPYLDGATMSLLWVIPFIGILLSIAIIPLIAREFWHHHLGKVSTFWAITLLIPLSLIFGIDLVVYEILNVGLLEYIPFIVLLLSLFIVAGGVRLTGTLRGTPAINTAILFLGTVIASWMSTTGASMLLIRPILKANEQRHHKVHIIVFFIFLVGNIGGSLTPLGDPPLFLGFLKGISFFWPIEHIIAPMALISLILLFVFYFIDRYWWLKEANDVLHEPTKDKQSLGLEGKVNILLLCSIIGTVLISGLWKTGISIEIYHVYYDLQNIFRDVLLLIFALISWKLTSLENREANGFSWFPIVEVAKLFAGIFLTIIPVIAILKAGTEGALKNIILAVSSSTGNPINLAYFWLTGLLSSFLDNAPTYLVFFNTAGGNVDYLVGPLSNTLLAISSGAVFMGANTYIGNAPNFMIKSIAEERGILMPSFFGYMLWSGLILVPVFLVIGFVFFA
ncbi:citrate transporter family protein [Candidatus Endolissoclinum faulkneri L2]|uniref:Citrate transporter family protein n=1 Tax=Candidatus Endolissoclinum faulkneri L2 TaxID=1193729 RepID=K7Z3S3_9PROT|nr:sodium:proton antiporter [Candidatus Endolissoclinum faulkneri]AFX98643.1 citrate transporter family protein [Candidatus Endolissoclinum faulkneri L2]